MSNDLTDAERMTKIETQIENVVLIVTKMDAKMDTWQASFVSKELLEEKLRVRDKEIEQLRNEVRRLENEKAYKDDIERIEKERTSFKNNLPFWITALLAAVATFISIWLKK